MDKLAENIKILREKKGISQYQLAKELFVTRQAVARWENGVTRPDIETIGKLADIFGVSVEYLITGKEIVKEVVVEKEVVKEVVKEVPVEKVVEKEVPPDDYDYIKSAIISKINLGIVFAIIFFIICLVSLIIILVACPIKEAWPIDLILVGFLIFLPIIAIKSIRRYINPNFLKKKKKKGDKNHEQKN